VLGPSVLIASPPFSIGYSLWACIRVKATVPVLVGLALAAAELLLIAALLMYALQARG
jgi:hypothetical protein